MITIKRTCPFCGKLRAKELDVTRQQMDDWEHGKMIQYAMPNLTADEREHLLTGICSGCWPSEED